jgi:uncharacterized protein (DUF488 family)|uniref:DUF488 domain-containing protein n=1 Tax=Desulfobacca acetoxidans TaxID=60893 RepID=A0A7C3UWJ2_9BACT
MEKPIIYTIGHSNHPEVEFMALLKRHAIEVVADVRSRPYSRFCPHFNREALTKMLQEAGIRYLFLGRELGGRPPDRVRPLADELLYEYLRSRPQFREALARLLEEARRFRVCLLCAEADPARCHRGQLLAPELADLGAQVRHIRGDGTLLEHRRLEIPGKPSQKRLF